MANNIVWQDYKISRTELEHLQRHRSLCVWFTGLSGAGKSTLANAVQQQMHELSIHTYLLDGDNMRHGLNEDLGFSAEDRKENVRRVAEVANLFVDAGVIAITALISPFEEDRAMARSKFHPDDYIEVFVDCPIETCIERDPKGLYKKAQDGLISNFTGISSPYETPQNSEVTVNTSQHTINECVEQIMDYILNKIQLNVVIS